MKKLYIFLIAICMIGIVGAGVYGTLIDNKILDKQNEGTITPSIENVEIESVTIDVNDDTKAKVMWRMKTNVGYVEGGFFMNTSDLENEKKINDLLTLNSNQGFDDFVNYYYVPDKTVDVTDEVKEVLK